MADNVIGWGTAIVSSGGPTATLFHGCQPKTVPTRGCVTVFQLVLGKQTSAMDSFSGC